MRVPFLRAFSAALLAVLCSCAAHKEKEEESPRLTYMPTTPTLLKNDSSERKILSRSKTLKEAKARAIDLGVVPFDIKTFPQIKNSLQNGSPVIIENKDELQLIVGHDPDKRIYLQRKGKTLSAIKAKELRDLYAEGGRKASIFSEPWEISGESDLKRAFMAGLKITKTNPRKARLLFEKLIEISPYTPEPYLALANAYPLSQSKEAVKVLEEGVKHNPNEFALWYNLAAYQDRSGEQWASQQTARKAQTMFDPADVPSRLRGRLSLLGSN